METWGHHDPPSTPGGGHHGSSARPNPHPLEPNAASGFSLRQPIPVLQGELCLHHHQRAASHNSMKLLNRSRCSTPLLTRSQDPEEIRFPSAKPTVANIPFTPFKSLCSTLGYLNHYFHTEGAWLEDWEGGSTD